MKKQSSSLDELPDIELNADECDAHFDPDLSSKATHPETLTLLMAELGRAFLHEPGPSPSNIVMMNEYIDFVDENTGLNRYVQSVYPSGAKISAGLVSVPTPIGAGLIGMSVGSSTLWCDRGGQSRALRIVNVIVADQVQADDNR